MKHLRAMTLALVSMIAAATWAHGLEPLPLPAVSTASSPAQLPRLAEGFIPDGALDEWKQSACVPVRSVASIAHRVTTHDWRGPADSGMELYVAWNEQGLCLAAVVADDYLGNDRPDGSLWQQDCLELFLDGRQGASFHTSSYSTGVFQLLARPPLPDRPAVVVPINSAQSTEGLHLGSRRTDAGYVTELLVPWALFPGLVPRPGTQVGLQCGLDDWDPRDGSATQPQMMTIGGAAGLSWNPSRFVRWELVDQIAAGKGTDLGTELQVDLPRIIAAGTPVRLGLTAGGWLAAQPRTLEARLQGPSGKAAWEARLQTEALPSPWEHSWQVVADLEVGALRPGRYSLAVEVRDPAGARCGLVRRDLYVLGDVVTPLYQALDQVPLAALAERDPFRAAAYCAVAVAVERHKRAVETGNVEEAVRAQHEALARLELLGGGKPKTEPAEDWLRWLRLGADPAAQVAVEYLPGYQSAAVTFLWGSAPLASVQITRYATPQAAEEAFARGEGQMGSSSRAPDTVIVDGCPARLATAYDYEIPFPPSGYSPERQAMLVSKGSTRLRVVDLLSLEQLSPKAAVLLPSCPAAAGQRVTAWAVARGIAVTDLAAALDSATVLVAGDPRLPETAPAFAPYTRWYEVRQQQLVSLAVLSGRRLLQVSHPSRQVGEEAVRLVLAGRTVTPQQVDGLRRRLVDWAGRQPAAPAPAGPDQLHWGDVHSHTFYSDGVSSPVANVLEALAVGLDFLVMTDHNTLAGARLAEQLAVAHGCAFPITVGQEVTTSYAHMNAYPVRELVAWDTTAAVICKAAHAQGAVIQWNHPGFPGSEWDSAHQRQGLAGTSFDAWEHHTPLLADWQGRGTAPVFVGSTDTHDGTFSWPERTVVRGAGAQGADLAEAIRAAEVAMQSVEGHELFYGREEVVAAVWAALAEGQRLKEEKATRIRQALQGVDLVGLLKASQPRPMAAE